MISFTDPLPLRTTAVWGQFRDATVIPHRYGEATGAPLQYDSARRLFVWADHPSLLVSEVRVGGQRINDWRFYNGTDETGHAVTYIEFGQPQDEGAQILASGIGKPHSRTGDPITNPADVLHDLLEHVVGMDVDESDLDVFRAQAATLDVRVGGSLDAIVSVQSACVALCASIGAVFCATMPGFARIYPGADLDTYVAAEIAGEQEVTTNVTVDDLANVVTVRFDYADGQPRRSLIMEAPDSIEDYGRREREIEAHWLTNGRVANEMATRFLRHYARPLYRFSASGLRGMIRVGETCSIDNARCPYSGTAFITSVQLDVPRRLRSGLGAVVAIGDTPRTRVVSQGSAFEPEQYAGVEIETVGDERRLKVQDTNGQPVGDAKVVLDGELTRYTDAAGRVTFPVSRMPPGEHRLDVTKDGMAPLSIEVTI